jgi:hypothetical protein
MSQVCATSSIERIRDIPALVHLYRPDTSVLVLERDLMPEILGDARDRLSRAPAHHVFTVRSADPALADRVAQELGEGPLAQDVLTWTEILADLTGVPHVGIRLARVERAMCPRFHVDRVTVRLVTTYIGEGTEFIDQSDIDRRWLGHETPDPREDHPDLRRSGSPIHQARAGDVVLLRGESWIAGEGKGAVHRSPPASHASPRLVLTLDPLG